VQKKEKKLKVRKGEEKNKDKRKKFNFIIQTPNSKI
jgi:hypothetical protein